jgi:ATP-binding cassette, subfamily B, bacterial
MIVVFTTRYIAPAARVSNAWDTKVGGTLADALTCNAVVKSFGAEAREDARLARVISRWRTRVRRTWLRYNYTSTAQLAVLLCLRGSVIGGALLLWMAGRASPGDVTYVLTSYYIIHAYLRAVGMHTTTCSARSMTWRNWSRFMTRPPASPMSPAHRRSTFAADVSCSRM